MKWFLTIGGRTVIALAAFLALGMFIGCGQDDLGNAEPADAHAEHDHGEEAEGSSSLSLKAIAEARCEHDMATYLCDECRYEVGVVKVSPDMLKETSADGGGLIVTEAITERRMTAGFDVTGEIQLNENEAVHVSPRIPGIIEKVYVDIGARVKKSDLLFKINSVELGKTLAAYELSRSLAELSRKNYEREKSLKEQNISSEQDLIEAQMTYEEYKSELAAAAEELHVFGLTDGDLKALQTQNSNGGSGSLPVRASINGTIIQKHAVTGELVEPGKDVLLLADLSSVWVWADIYEKDLPRLLAAEGAGAMPVSVRVRAFPDTTFKGSIDYIGATMDEATRTIKVRATVMNKDGRLRPGMFCEIHIDLESDRTALVVPKAALLSDEGVDFVFTFWKEDLYVRRTVRTGHELFDMVEVIEGLNPGDRVVTAGAFLLKSDVLREKMGAGCAD
jgi:cobalt-zinc-cadmium efflux system membrane fusion protein